MCVCVCVCAYVYPCVPGGQLTTGRVRLAGGGKGERTGLRCQDRKEEGGRWEREKEKEKEKEKRRSVEPYPRLVKGNTQISYIS